MVDKVLKCMSETVVLDKFQKILVVDKTFIDKEVDKWRKQGGVLFGHCKLY